MLKGIRIGVFVVPVIVLISTSLLYIAYIKPTRIEVLLLKNLIR